MARGAAAARIARRDRGPAGRSRFTQPMPARAGRSHPGDRCPLAGRARRSGAEMSGESRQPLPTYPESRGAKIRPIPKSFDRPGELRDLHFSRHIRGKKRAPPGMRYGPKPCDGVDETWAPTFETNADERNEPQRLASRRRYRGAGQPNSIATANINLMSNLPPQSTPHEMPTTPDGSLMTPTGAPVEMLLGALEGPGEAFHRAAQLTHENQLAQARLGIASGLFTALQSKHAATAAHSVRVALSCSSWALALKLHTGQKDEIEVAALLHDVGKIGVPDNVLLKPGKLTASEAVLMNRHRTLGLTILRSCCSSQPVLDIVHYSPAWYNGGRGDYDRSGDDLPLCARMLAIVDAFDSMTTDHIYRRGMPRERALGELFRCAGTQFDASLVRDFAQLQQSDHAELHQRVVHRWLEELEESATMWERDAVMAPTGQVQTDALFHQKLLDNMRDGVVFIDSNLQIQLWNRGAERLTGLPSSSVFQRSWQPSLIGLADEKGKMLVDEDCPVQFVLHSGVQSIRRLILANQKGRQVSIDLHVVPVIGHDGTTYGANVLLHDASPEASLEERCQSLHERATRDPLTQVANRAEFDRAHKRFVETHLKQGRPCSLIICDIDHFKKVNDTYGHQAGDEAIKTFAQLLKQMCRPGDLVARYGGEEFVVLCADCDNATAARRAEQIRRSFSDLPLPMLGGNRISASFGVTETQPGDTDATMLRRADRALLMAKDSGRNAVVQLGTGSQGEKAKSESGWFRWASSAAPNAVVESNLVTPVPLKVAVEKLRGFVADHHGAIEKIDGNCVIVRVDAKRVGLLRRSSDRPVGFIVEIGFAEEQFKKDPKASGRNQSVVRTKAHVSIRPQRHRDRRRSETGSHAQHLLASVRSYLMATEADHEPEKNVLDRATELVSTWLQHDE
ncbi:MAG: diguanylate cyclase [Planctomycetota bacterium]|nr:MAG: diguanylate cyclase [Planctomycetota bacterium]